MNRRVSFQDPRCRGWRDGARCRPIVLTAVMTVMAATAAVSAAVPATAGGAGTYRISVSADGSQGDGSSGDATISADGQYVAFGSDASNLVPGDTNGFADVFVRDLRTHRVVRVSMGSTGAQGNGPAGFASISADGRYVTYTTTANNVVPGDTNGESDVFVHDRLTRTVVRASASGAGAQASGWSAASKLSADGRYVAFQSGAANLVPGDTNDTWDVFVRDLRVGTTTRVNVSDVGAQTTGAGTAVVISGNGRFVAWFTDTPGVVAGDADAMVDTFVRDWWAGTTERISQTFDGAPPDSGSLTAAMSHDGRYVAFESGANNLVAGDTNQAGDVFVRDRSTGTTSLVSLPGSGGQANGHSANATISADGRYVGFTSDASNLVAGDSNDAGDVFLRDRRAGTTERISVSTAGRQGDGFSFIHPMAISADGRRVVFSSNASTLVRMDGNDVGDAFLRIRIP